MFCEMTLLNGFCNDCLFLTYSIKLIFIKTLLPELPALRIFLLAPVPEADNEEVEDEVDPGNNKNQFTT
jgi:hypothetical protein